MVQIRLSRWAALTACYIIIKQKQCDGLDFCALRPPIQAALTQFTVFRFVCNTAYHRLPVCDQCDPRVTITTKPGSGALVGLKSYWSSTRYLVCWCVLCWLKQGKPAKHVRATKCSTSPSCTAASILHHSCCTACTALSTCNPSDFSLLDIPVSLWLWFLLNCLVQPAASGPCHMLSSPRCCVAALGLQHRTARRHWRTGSLGGSRAPVPARHCILQRSGISRFYVLMRRPRFLQNTNPHVSHVPCAELGVQTAPGMNTHHQLGVTPGCQLKVGWWKALRIIDCWRFEVYWSSDLTPERDGIVNGEKMDGISLSWNGNSIFPPRTFINHSAHWKKSHSFKERKWTGTAG